jgi:hypothetical protein
LQRRLLHLASPAAEGKAISLHPQPKARRFRFTRSRRRGDLVSPAAEGKAISFHPQPKARRSRFTRSRRRGDLVSPAAEGEVFLLSRCTSPSAAGETRDAINYLISIIFLYIEL